MRAAVLAVVLILTACGSASGPNAKSSIQPSATATPGSSPAPSATASPHRITPPAVGLLFAVVENSVASGCCGGPTGVSADTVAIVGLDGRARAKATFLPRKLPPIGGPAVVLQAPALVAGSGVYYIDGSGTVRVLRVGSQPQAVATFSDQHPVLETWLAVSPDGSRIVAGVLARDTVGWYFNLMTAPVGGASKLVTVTESVSPPSDPTSGVLGDWAPDFPVGWTSAGPVVMEPISITTQNAWRGGPLEVLTLDPAAPPLQILLRRTSVGGVDCAAATITINGFIPCTSSKDAVTVRGVTGNLIWATHVTGFNALSLYVSPDGQAISDGHQASSDGGATWYMVVETDSRGTINLPKGFRVEGWLDRNTVIGAVTPPASGDEGNLSWVSLNDPSTVHDLGFKGAFVAALG